MCLCVYSLSFAVIVRHLLILGPVPGVSRRNESESSIPYVYDGASIRTNKLFPFSFTRMFFRGRTTSAQCFSGQALVVLCLVGRQTYKPTDSSRFLLWNEFKMANNRLWMQFFALVRCTGRTHLTKDGSLSHDPRSMLHDIFNRIYWSIVNCGSTSCRGSCFPTFGDFSKQHLGCNFAHELVWGSCWEETIIGACL